MVPFNDLKPKISKNREALIQAFSKVLDSGWVINGPMVKAFEADFAKAQGVAHAIGVANGTEAIEIGLKALGAKPGDRIATVANAGMYTTTSILAIGGVPIFMDVDEQTRCTTLVEVRKALVQGAKFVVITHLYGTPVPETRAMVQACHQAGAKLFEDCAQAHGALVDGQPVGGLGDASSFSFYPTKNLGALGDGGAVLTTSTDVANLARKFRQYGWGEKYHVEMTAARNSRLDEVQAAILSVFLGDLPDEIETRRAMASRYSQGLRHPALVIPPPPGPGLAPHLYVLQSSQRESLRKWLRENGVSDDIHYPIPDHQQKAIAGTYPGLRLPVTEKLCREILSLPFYIGLTEESQEAVIKVVNAWKP